MQRDTILAGSLAAVVAVTLLAAILVPGVFAAVEDDRPSHLRLQEDDSTVRVLSVPGETVELQLDSRLRHHGAPAENVTVEVRAIDAESGLLEDSREQSVGEVSGGRTVPVTTNVTVPREGGYEIETLVYRDGVREYKGHLPIDGVGSLTPDYARSSVEFQRFRTEDEGFGAVATKVRSVNGDRATLNVTSYLRNVGGDDSGDVRVRLRARQAESNVVADSTAVRVGDIGPGATEGVHADLTVPDRYNYWLDAILLSDGVVVDTTTVPANLLPNETLDRSAPEDDDSGFSTGDFAGTEEQGDERGADGRTPTDSPTGPGFGAAVALVALVAAALLAARRQTP